MYKEIKREIKNKILSNLIEYDGIPELSISLKQSSLSTSGPSAEQLVYQYFLFCMVAEKGNPIACM